MNGRQQPHIDFYLERLGYWKALEEFTTARMLAARDADGAHTLRTEGEATEVVEQLRRLEPSAEVDRRPTVPGGGEVGRNYLD